MDGAASALRIIALLVLAACALAVLVVGGFWLLWLVAGDSISTS